MTQIFLSFSKRSPAQCPSCCGTWCSPPEAAPAEIVFRHLLLYPLLVR